MLRQIAEVLTNDMMRIGYLHAVLCKYSGILIVNNETLSGRKKEFELHKGQMKMRKDSDIETSRGYIYCVPLTTMLMLLIEKMAWLQPPSVFAHHYHDSV
jgi:hypothetical protein